MLEESGQQVPVELSYAPDLTLLLRPMQRGRGDPTLQFRTDGVWRTTTTPDGPVTQRLAAHERVVSSTCWGPGTAWMQRRTPDLLGAADRTAERFRPTAAGIAEQWRRVGDRWRVPRGHNVWESAVAAVLEQKVTGLEAKRAWSALARDFGTAAPGPGAGFLTVFPDARRLRRIPSWTWRRNAVDRARSDTLMRLAHVAHVLERLPAVPLPEARRLLTAVPGVGEWTYAEIAQRALGDPDAVSVGDFHLAKDIVHAATGEFDGSDEQMLAILAPYTGHRYRWVRMFELTRYRQPRRGPRFAVPAHRFG